MLGQGLESLIPPQKSKSGDTSSSPSLMPAAREENLVPQVGSTPVPAPTLASTPQPIPAKPIIPEPQKKEVIFLPKEEEEKFLEPPAIIHQEPSKPLVSIPSVVTTPSSAAPSVSPIPPVVAPLHPIASVPNPVAPPEPAPTSKPTAAPAVFSNAIRPEVKKAAMGEAVFLVEVEKIKPNPHQPRRHFDEAALKDLAGSIREHGILQPLVVTKIETEVPGGTNVEYQLIAGERRLMASKIAGLERVPVIVRTLDQGQSQSLELAIIENLQREDLNPIEMARAFARLQDEFRMTQREIATRLGKSRETVANTLRLLDLPFDVQESIAIGKISESHGRLLLSMKDPAVQDKLFKDLVNKSLTTRELRAQVAAGDGVKHREKKVMPELKMFQERLAAILGAPVSINQTGESGRITINFYSHEELENILEHLAKTLGPEDEHHV